MYAVIRRYRGASPLLKEMERRSGEVESLIRAVPGFLSYFAVRAGDQLATITICEDRKGTQESTKRASAWVKENLPSGSVSAPEVTEGDVFLTFRQMERIAR